MTDTHAPMEKETALVHLVKEIEKLPLPQRAIARVILDEFLDLSHNLHRIAEALEGITLKQEIIASQMRKKG